MNAVSAFQTALQIPESAVFKSDDPKTQGRLKKDERVHTAHTLCWNWKFCAGYGLLTIKKS